MNLINKEKIRYVSFENILINFKKRDWVIEW